MLTLAAIFSSFSITSCAKSNKADFSVVLATDPGGISDQSFNQSAWDGITSFAKSQGLTKDQFSYLQMSSEADYIPNLTMLAEDGNNLIITPGFTFARSVEEVAKNFPNTNFFIIDVEMTNSEKNIGGVVFKEEQGSFLVGVIAALQGKTENKTKFGFIGGMDSLVLRRFEAGFEAGIKAINPDASLTVEYAESFTSPQLGQAIAKKMYDSGVGIIYSAASTTGNGAIKEAKDRAAAGDSVWIIGVDKDQFNTGLYAEDKSVVLTSMVKKINVATSEVLKMAYNGNFPAGQTLLFSLKDDGVGIPEQNPNVSEEILAVVEEYKTKIINEEIIVPEVPSRMQK